MGFFNLPKPEVWIEPGSRVTRIFYKGELLEEEPTLIALEEPGGRFLAAGTDALKMMHSNASNTGKYKFIWPINVGISDFQNSEEFLRALLYRHSKRFSIFGLLQPAYRMIFIISPGSADLELRAWRDLGQHSGALEIYFIDKPVLILKGLGVNIATTAGCAIIDMGSSKTEIAVYAKGEFVAGEQIRIGQRHLIKSVKLNFRKEQGKEISEQAAEQLIKTDSTVLAWIGKYYGVIQETLWAFLDTLPPAVARAVAATGIHLCGGGAINSGIVQALGFENKIQLHLVPNEGELLQQSIQGINQKMNKELFYT